MVDVIIASLKEEYGKVGEMTVRRGKIHDYLWITLDFSSIGSLVIDMEQYLDTVLEGVPEDMKGLVITPAANHLFKTREGIAKLDPDCAELFHRITAQLLFVSLLNGETGPEDRHLLPHQEGEVPRRGRLQETIKDNKIC